jgi:hypothetical protein
MSLPASSPDCIVDRASLPSCSDLSKHRAWAIQPLLFDLALFCFPAVAALRTQRLHQPPTKLAYHRSPEAVISENDSMAVQRGDYGSSTFTKGLFLAGCLASGPLQYALITAHPLVLFGIPPLPTGGLVHVLGYSFQRLPLLTALMPAVLSIKQVLWISCWCRERMTISRLVCYA